MNTAISFALTLIVALWLGYKGGQALDNWLNTYPWFTLLGIGIGTTAGFRVIIREIENLNKRDPQENDSEGRSE